MSVTKLPADYRQPPRPGKQGTPGPRGGREAGDEARAADGEAYLTIAAGHTPRAEVHPYPQPGRMRSRLFIKRLELDARIGVYDTEKNRVQRVMVDLEFGLSTELACHTDRLSDSIDYAEVVASLRDVATRRHYELVEALAETMAFTLQRDFGAPWLVLSLSKLAPFPGAEVGIVIERGQRS